MSESEEWETEDELKFVSNLGAYSEKESKLSRPYRRLSLLLGYKRSIGRRSEWGCVNQVMVAGLVRKMLAKELGNASRV